MKLPELRKVDVHLFPGKTVLQFVFTSHSGIWSFCIVYYNGNSRIKHFKPLPTIFKEVLKLIRVVKFKISQLFITYSTPISHRVIREKLTYSFFGKNWTSISLTSDHGIRVVLYRKF